MASSSIESQKAREKEYLKSLGAAPLVSSRVTTQPSLAAFEVEILFPHNRTGHYDRFHHFNAHLQTPNFCASDTDFPVLGEAGKQIQHRQTQATKQWPKILPAEKRPTLFPLEIWSKILSDERLSLKDVKNARLSCTMLSKAGRAPLFQTFVFRRDREDIQQLCMIGRTLNTSKSGFVLENIRAVRFESGVVNAQMIARELTMQLYHERRNPMNKDGPVLSWNKSGSDMDRSYLYGILRADWHSEKHTEAIQESVSWYDQVLRSKQTYDTAALRSLLKLERLEEIHVTRMSVPFKTHFASEAWKRCDTENIHFQATNWELRKLLDTIVQHNKKRKEDKLSRWKPISRFSHDELPVTFFRLPSRCELFVKAFQNIHSLHLSFDGFTIPPKQFWYDVAKCLSSCRKLKDLKLGFDPSFKRSHFDRCYDTPHFARPSFTAPEFNRDLWLCAAYIPLWMIFKTTTWPDLEVLRLDGLSVCEQGLKHLLLRNASIRKLYLCEISLTHGSWKSLLGFIRAKLSLEDFETWGNIRSIHGKDDLGMEERWVFPAPENTWKSSPVEAAPGIKERLINLEGNHTGRDSLENFVLRKGAWPQTKLLYGKRQPRTVRPRRPLGHFDRLHTSCDTDTDGNCSPCFSLIEFELSHILNAQQQMYKYRGWEVTPTSQQLPTDTASARMIQPNWESGLQYIDGFDINGHNVDGWSVQETKAWTRDVTYLKNACARATIDEMVMKLEELGGNAPNS